MLSYLRSYYEGIKNFPFPKVKATLETGIQKIELMLQQKS